MSADNTGLETTRLTAKEAIHRAAAQHTRLLLLLSHRSGAETVELTPDKPVVVGREPPADVEVPEPSLSRRHARFLLSGGQVVVEDLGSTNGTYWQGQRIQHQELQPGDEVALGTVVASLQAINDHTARIGGLERHDAFRRALDAELVRARYFRRQLALVMIRSAGRAHVRHWYHRVTELLRPVDCAALYSADTVEVLLPEAGREQAETLAQALTRPSDDGERLLIGLAIHPDSATSAEELMELARRAAHQASTRQPACVAPAEGAKTFGPEASLGDAPVVVSEAMRSVVQTAKRLARGVIPVLLQGETGTGKEVVARIIHESGPRREEPLVCVNCAAIAESLLESTLFGHERGAFTGATGRRRGVFEAADGGTVLLDEVGELSASAQAALLRVLETKRITRVGSSEETPVNVRVMAATHRDLGAMCEQGSFRQDLFYRLNAMTLKLPPLRARRDEIEPLALRFLEEANEANAASVVAIDPDAMAVLRAHDWPGNVRELRNAIERAVVIAENDTISIEDLPETLRSLPEADPEVPCDFRGQMDRLEAELLTDALSACGYNQRATAQRLQMPLRTLVHKIKVHGIKRP